MVNTCQSQNRQIPSHTTLVALVKPARKKKRRKVAFQKSRWENHVRKDSELALNCNIQSSRAKEGFCSWMREGSSSISIKHHRERKVSLDVMEMKQPEVNLHVTWKPPERGWKPWDYLGHLKLSWIRWIRHPITHSEEKPLLTSWGGTPKGPTHISYAGVVSTIARLVKHSAIPEHYPVVSNAAKCRQSNTEGSLQAPETVLGSLAHHQPLMRVPSFAQADCWLTRN